MRMNISIPDTLREEMREYDDLENWSEIAGRAFRHRTDSNNKYKSSANTTLLDKMADRLAGEYKTQVEEAGKSDGLRWAAEIASLDELARLEEKIEEDECLEFVFIHEEHAASFVSVIQEEFSHPHEVTILARELEDAVGVDGKFRNDSRYWVAFCHSAVEAFQKVKDRIPSSQ